MKEQPISYHTLLNNNLQYFSKLQNNCLLYTIALKLERPVRVIRWPDILPKDSLPKKILPNGHFADSNEL